MDNSVPKQGSSMQQEKKSFLVALPILGSIIKWLTSLIHWTEEEQKDAGIYLDRPGGE